MRRLTTIGLCGSAVLALSANLSFARDLPDLQIVSTELRHSGDCSGRRPLVIGEVKVQNAGQGRGQIFTTKVMLQARSKLYTTLRGDDRFVNSMRPGEIVTVEARINSSGRVTINGPVELELVVNPVNVFPEENETNNTSKVMVDIRCPG